MPKIIYNRYVSEVWLWMIYSEWIYDLIKKTLIKS
jgi:hypothetical protein